MRTLRIAGIVVVVVAAVLAMMVVTGISGSGGASDTDAAVDALLRAPYGALLTLPAGQRSGHKNRPVVMLACAYLRDSLEADDWLSLVRRLVTNETLDPPPPYFYLWARHRCFVRLPPSPADGDRQQGSPASRLLFGPASAKHPTRGLDAAALRRGHEESLLKNAPAREVFVVNAVRTLADAHETHQWNGGGGTANVLFEQMHLLRLFYRVVALTDAGTIEPVLLEHRELLQLAEALAPSAELRKRAAYTDDPEQVPAPCLCPLYLGLFDTGFYFYWHPRTASWTLLVGVHIPDEPKCDTRVPLEPSAFETLGMRLRREEWLRLVQQQEEQGDALPEVVYWMPKYAYYVLYDVEPRMLKPATYLKEHLELTGDEVEFRLRLQQTLNALQHESDDIRQARSLGSPVAGAPTGPRQLAADASMPLPPALDPAELAFAIPFSKLAQPLKRIKELDNGGHACVAYCEALEARVLAAAAADAAATRPDSTGKKTDM